MIQNLQPDIKTIDVFANWYAIPKAELQHHIAWYFK
jgi:hypothetical protein